ncbi:MAG: hypothetical protein CMA31_02095 [Euryarchaeota archaeon]|nr:hypothetical protein [Euryarchaeota archaeon]
MSVSLTDIKMLESLVCPITHNSLRLSQDKSELISISAKLAFPIRDGIPILVINAARSLD